MSDDTSEIPKEPSPGLETSPPSSLTDAVTSNLLGPAHRAPMLRQVVVETVGVRLPETFGRLVLIELDPPKRKLEIPISLEQAGIISGVVNGKKPPRPMTGDLFCEVLDAFDLRVEVVQIIARVSGTFLAQLTVTGAAGRPKTFPCRPSDGVILALGQTLPVPILVDESLF